MQVWAMGFVRDKLIDVRRAKVVTVVDKFGKENHVLEFDTGLIDERVVNLSDFIFMLLDKWAYSKGVNVF